MNYESIYKRLVSNKAKRIKDKSNYYETHHIIPRSMGGGNEKSNLVLLTAREHFVAHKLLTKIYPKSWKMKFALFMMAQENTKGAKGLLVSSVIYEKLRKDVINSRKELAVIPGCLEFNHNIKLALRVTSKLRSKWRLKDSLKSAISVIICNGVIAYEQNILVCYRRGRTAYSLKDGKASSPSLLKAIDMLVGMDYVEDIRSDSDLAVSKMKLSVYKLTDLGYTKFTTLGEKI